MTDLLYFYFYMIDQAIQKHLINFEALNPFTGNNADFAKQLVTALLSEMQSFTTKIKETPTEEDIEVFRKANHSISPSLQMLEMHTLTIAIAEYKNACINDKSEVAVCAKKVNTLLQLAIEEAKKWVEA
jgi:HPt (histidine-containing phosphotransfer) domain-containing protein